MQCTGFDCGEVGEKKAITIVDKTLGESVAR